MTSCSVGSRVSRNGILPASWACRGARWDGCWRRRANSVLRDTCRVNCNRRRRVSAPSTPMKRRCASCCSVILSSRRDAAGKSCVPRALAAATSRSGAECVPCGRGRPRLRWYASRPVQRPRPSPITASTIWTSRRKAGGACTCSATSWASRGEPICAGWKAWTSRRRCANTSALSPTWEAWPRPVCTTIKRWWCCAGRTASRCTIHAFWPSPRITVFDLWRASRERRGRRGRWKDFSAMFKRVCWPAGSSVRWRISTR